MMRAAALAVCLAAPLVALAALIAPGLARIVP